jgi:hypothetical protein
MGFQLLSAAGKWKLTGEHLVNKHAHRFAPSDVEAARKRLEERGFNIGTGRSQAKAVLTKTDTHRQAELVALLTRLAMISERDADHE